MAQNHPKIAVIGCGYWGKNLVRNFANLGALAAIYDENPENCKKYEKEYNLQERSLDQILNDPSIEAVAIATPAITHAAIAKKALEADKHVFVEKPLATDLEDAKAVSKLAAERGKVLMVGHLLLYHPAFQKLKSMVNEGVLGRLQYIYSNRMNFGKIRREENILWSFAPHDISMILNLTGEEPSHVQAVGSKFLHDEIQDVSITHLGFPSGIKGHVFVSWLHPYKEQKLVVIGDQGMVVFNDALPWSDKLRFYPHKLNWENGLPVLDKAEYEAIPVEEEEPLKNECLHFLECASRNQNPVSDAKEGLRVLSVLQSAQASLNADHTDLSSTETDNITPFRHVFVHDTAHIDQPVEIGENTKIWHHAHILPKTKIGKNCVIGQNVMAGPDVRIGNNCKIQNNVSVYKGVTLEDGVFCGPSCVFTNVVNPRAEIERKEEFKETLVKKGASIGANATILCGITLGSYCFIGAGSVVTKNVPDHALMMGNPARQTGWMSRAGAKLGPDLVCPLEGLHYHETENGLEAIESQTGVKA